MKSQKIKKILFLCAIYLWFWKTAKGNQKLMYNHNHAHNVHTYNKCMKIIYFSYDDLVDGTSWFLFVKFSYIQAHLFSINYHVDSISEESKKDCQNLHENDFLHKNKNDIFSRRVYRLCMSDILVCGWYEPVLIFRCVQVMKMTTSLKFLYTNWYVWKSGTQLVQPKRSSVKSYADHFVVI